MKVICINQNVYRTEGLNSQNIRYGGQLISAVNHEMILTFTYQDGNIRVKGKDNEWYDIPERQYKNWYFVINPDSVPRLLCSDYGQVIHPKTQLVYELSRGTWTIKTFKGIRLKGRGVREISSTDQTALYSVTEKAKSSIVPQYISQKRYFLD